MTDAERYRLILTSRIESTNLQLDKLYSRAEFQLINAVVKSEIDDYQLSKNPILKKKIEEIIKKLNSSATDIIIAGVESSWALSDEKNDKFVKGLFKKKDEEIPPKYLTKSNAQNNKALSAFIERKTNGLDLSENVWKYNDGYKTQIENALQIGIGNGISANDMSKYLIKYLQNPTAAMAEYDEKNISAEIPQSRKGQPGIYSSPKKNAMRLARTEINMAYDTADNNRYQNLDFVVGYEVHTSGNHTTKSKGKIIKINDICDKLAGKYPKDFKFTGWHPQCRCYVTAILKTDEEQDEEDLAILRGGDPDKKESKNTVKDVPDGFKKWVEDNKERLEESSSLPYFVRDNKDYFSGIDFKKKVQKQFEEDKDLSNIIQGTTSVSKKLTAKEILAKKHAQRTDAEKAEILKNWESRYKLKANKPIIIDDILKGFGALDTEDLIKENLKRIFKEHYDKNKKAYNEEGWTENTINGTIDDCSLNYLFKWFKRKIFKQTWAQIEIENKIKNDWEIVKNFDASSITNDIWRKKYQNAILYLNAAKTDNEKFKLLEYANNIIEYSKIKDIGTKNVSLYMPIELFKKFSSDIDLELMAKFFDSQSDFRPFVNAFSDDSKAYCQTKGQYHYVFIDLSKKRYAYDEGLSRVIFHEYGHSDEAFRKLTQNQDIIDLYSKFKDKYKDIDKKEFIDKINKYVSDNEIKDSTLAGEQLGAYTDIMHSICRFEEIVWSGHKNKYWEQSDHYALTEFIAHLSELNYQGNPILYDIDKEMYNDMNELIKKIYR